MPSNPLGSTVFHVRCSDFFYLLYIPLVHPCGLLIIVVMIFTVRPILQNSLDLSDFIFGALLAENPDDGLFG